MSFIIGLSFGIVVGAIAGALTVCIRTLLAKRKTDKWNYRVRLFEKKYNEFIKDNLSLMPYFDNEGITKVVVYGLGFYYTKFIDLIDEDRLTIVYGDKNNDASRDILSLEEIIKTDADLIIVTAITYFDEIYSSFRKLGEKRLIISFQDLLFNAEREKA